MQETRPASKNCADCGKPLSQVEMASGLTKCTPCSAERLRSPQDTLSRMNACVSCGAKMSAGEAFCPACGATDPAATEPSSLWWRVITGIIGVPLAGTGLYIIAEELSTGCGDVEQDGHGICSAFRTFDLLVGAGIALLGVPFFIATFGPFGRFRRVMVGVGVAAIGGIVFAVILFLILPWAAVLALPAAAGLFYLGYRMAR